MILYRRPEDKAGQGKARQDSEETGRDGKGGRMKTTNGEGNEGQRKGRGKGRHEGKEGRGDMKGRREEET